MSSWTTNYCKRSDLWVRRMQELKHVPLFSLWHSSAQGEPSGQRSGLTPVSTLGNGSPRPAESGLQRRYLPGPTVLHFKDMHLFNGRKEFKWAYWLSLSWPKVDQPLAMQPIQSSGATVTQPSSGVPKFAPGFQPLILPGWYGRAILVCTMNLSYKNGTF